MRKLVVILLAAVILAPMGLAAAQPRWEWPFVDDVPEATDFPFIEQLNWPDTALIDAPMVIGSAWSESMLDATAVRLYISIDEDGKLRLNYDGYESDLRRVLTLCQRHGILPIFEVWEEDVVDALLEFLDDINMQDGVILSVSADILRRMHTQRPQMSRALWAMASDEPNAIEVAAEAHRAGASIVVTHNVMPTDAEMEAYIRALQRRMLTVWVSLPDGHFDAWHQSILQAPDGLMGDPTLLRNAIEQYTGTPILLRSPLLIGHRGAPMWAPENTLEGAMLAMAQGADGVEMDALHTADRHLVLMHDDTVDATTDGRGRVRDMTLEQIRELTANVMDTNYTSSDVAQWLPEDFPDIRVPTLREYFEYFDENHLDGILFIEIKSQGQLFDIDAELLRDLVEEFNFQDRIVFISFNLSQQSQRMKELLPEVPMTYLTSRSGGRFGTRTQVQLTTSNFAALNRNAGDFTMEEVRDARARGVLTGGWTYNSSLLGQEATFPTFAANYVTGMAVMTTADVTVGAAIPVHLTRDGVATARDGTQTEVEIEILTLADGVEVAKTIISLGEYEFALLSEPFEQEGTGDAGSLVIERRINALTLLLSGVVVVAAVVIITLIIRRTKKRRNNHA
ncbi:MAG: hypothetical protein FWE06_06075 [Oscillospiraceae bacterium]|nr:hypothetical protein [Oscillospiraceae bacterium]